MSVSIVRVLDAIAALRYTPWSNGDTTMMPRWVLTDELCRAMPDVPHKVLHAKLSKMLRRGYVIGCDCGCRGDWEIAERGAAVDPPFDRPGWFEHVPGRNRTLT